MRKISPSLSEKLHKNIQTRANKAAPSANLWVGRPTTTLMSDQFLERQTVLSGSVTDVSIAVCHPKERSGNTRVSIGYISDGIARVVSAAHKYTMEDHVWADTGFYEVASAISVAYDGTMPKVSDAQVEFITERTPWVFWVNEGALYGCRLGEEPILLAETNCTDVSAIRAIWSNVGGFDFGLVVFFILSGNLYYRQLINGVWMDAEVVTFGPDVTWSEIAAFNTWDYRVGVQGKTTDGAVYELFTQFMGVGKQNTEHIELQAVNVKSSLVGVDYSNTQNEEHVEVADITAGAPYGGLYSLDMPVLLSARNIASDDGDWGKIVVVEFSNYLVASQVAENYTSFKLIDSLDAQYTAMSATLGENGKTVTLEFLDFNSAEGECEIRYIPGTVYSMATVAVQETSTVFTPKNIVHPGVSRPEVESMWNE